jgi:hypothetical protein
MRNDSTSNHRLDARISLRTRCLRGYRQFDARDSEQCRQAETYAKTHAGQKEQARRDRTWLAGSPALSENRTVNLNDRRKRTRVGTTSAGARRLDDEAVPTWVRHRAAHDASTTSKAHIAPRRGRAPRPRPTSRRHDTTLRHATLRHEATRSHATPRDATRRHEATRRHDATPRHATRHHAPPRHAPPRHATPRRRITPGKAMNLFPLLRGPEPCGRRGRPLARSEHRGKDRDGGDAPSRIHRVLAHAGAVLCRERAGRGRNRQPPGGVAQFRAHVSTRVVNGRPAAAHVRCGIVVSPAPATETVSLSDRTTTSVRARR